jgi:xylulokinase
MLNKYIIGIDIGTQGTKTSLVSTAGKIVADSFEDSKLIRPGTGMVQQDADDIYFSVLRTIKDVVEKSGINGSDVISIAIDGQMAGIMAIDQDWNAVTYYDSWLDTRCEKYIRQMKAEGEDKIIQLTGCPITYAHGPKVMWWKGEHPEVYEKIRKFVMPSVYAAGRMTGLKADQAYIDYTYLHFSGFADTKNSKWSEELLDNFGVSIDKMPQIVEPWKVIGHITTAAAAASGLDSGVPVVAGCGDSAATSLGAGITKKGYLFDMAGTASIFSCCVDEYNSDITAKTLMFAKSVIPGLWNPMAYINGGGMCLKWFQDNLTGKEGKTSMRELDEEAREIVAGSESLLFIPHFSGRVCPNNPLVRGGYLGLSWIHDRRHMYRAIMEGIAYEYKYYLETIQNLIPDVSLLKVIAVGGGAKSELFNSIKADVLGIKYCPELISNTAALGCAAIAGYGVQAYDSIESAVDQFVKFSDEIKPNMENHEKYAKFATIYKNSFQPLEGIFKELI